MITREKQIDFLDCLSYFPIIAIVGARQVGKTTLAKQMSINNVNKKVVYLDLENPKDISKLNDPVLFFEMNQNNCVILDEIQCMPELFPILRSMVDAHRVPARFILLGSASPDLIRDSSETLAGRIVYDELTPLSFTEVKNVSTVYYHWFSGGYPEAFKIKKDRIRHIWMANFVKTYVERDLPMLGLDADRLIIRKLWVMLAHINGDVLNYTTLSRSLGLTSPTIKKYLSFLEDAFLIKILQPFSTNLKKRLVKSPKVYIRDTGMLHYLLGIGSFDDLMSNPALGGSWEGYVIEQISQKVRDTNQVYYYRTQVGAECDLVIATANKVLASIEIKFTSTPKTSKGMLQSFEDLNAKQNFIITPKTDDYMLTKSIRVCSLETFLNVYMNGIVS